MRSDLFSLPTWRKQVRPHFPGRRPVPVRHVLPANEKLRDRRAFPEWPPISRGPYVDGQPQAFEATDQPRGESGLVAIVQVAAAEVLVLGAVA